MIVGMTSTLGILGCGDPMLTQHHAMPKPDNPAWGALKDAFDATCDEELLPMKQAEECAVRAVIDEAAALALGLPPEARADWRRRLAAEPTVSNRPAPGPEAA